MTTRRRFIQIVPLSGVALLAACSRTPEPAAPAAQPAAAPAAPAPPAVVAAPAASPASNAAATPSATAAVLPMVDEKEPQAVALAYVDDAARVDKVKYKSYVAGSQCGNCAVYLGKAGDAVGPCPLFAGKHVATKGWCSAWAKKA